MINFMIVSPNHDDLSKYFMASSGNTITVSHSYTSLYQNLDGILNNTMKIDKLVMVIRPSSNINYKNEIKALHSLLEEKAFFKVNNIWFFAEHDDYSENIVQMLKTILDDLNYTNYNIKISDDLSSTNIYKEVVGIISAENSHTTFNTIYRVQADDESKVGYSPRERQENVIPVVNNTYKEYNKYKDNTYKIYSSVVENEVLPKGISKADIEVPEVPKSEFNFKNITIVTGLAKSGTTSLSCNITDNVDNCVIVDVSNSLGILHLATKFETQDKKFREVPPKDLLFGKVFDDRCVKYTYSLSPKDKFTYLNFILNNPQLISYDEVIIDCDLEDLDKLLLIVDKKLKYIFFSCDSTKEYFELTKPYLERDYGCEVHLFLNEYYKNSKFYNYISPAEVGKLTSRPIITGDNLVEYAVDVDMTV